MVFKTYAVADPWTMVIHSKHTLVANRTMMGTRWLHTLALITVSKLDCSSDILRNCVLDVVHQSSR